MNKNNQKIFNFVVVIGAIFLLGYFLFRNSPNKIANTDSAASTSNSSVHDHGGTAVSVNSEQLNSLVGKPLPDIQLTDKDGNIITNESLKGKNTVLFFNEGLMCYPACWNQIAMFGSDSRFDTDQIQAMSIVVDPSRDWQKAITQMPELAKSKTLFDVNADVSGKLGLLTLPSSMHRGQLPGHTYIVLDKDGIVKYVKDDPNMAIANDLLMGKMAEF
ncbi:MAG: redoxin domain-containing protein [Candidatus Paceibacterota bacterium]